jgi:hypothetical protein
VVIDPVARRIDGEAVRIAKDVLCAGATTKICLPEGPEEIARALSRRGSRRPVVVGDDAALMRIVGMLYRERSLGDAALALVPVGASSGAVALARALGVPTGPVEAARTVLDGVDRRMHLLVDDSDGVVLGDVRIPATPVASGEGTSHEPWWATGLRTCRSLARSVRGLGLGLGQADAGQELRRTPAVPGQAGRDTPGERGGPGIPKDRGVPGGRSERDDHDKPGVPGGRNERGVPEARISREGRPGARASRGSRGPHRLRVEADGVLLVDLDQPVEAVSVTTAPPHADTAFDDGLAQVVVHMRPSAEAGDTAPRTAWARAITVSGADFRYRADALVGGPVRTRTWTVRPSAWQLTLPRA